jgi:outer membrane protein assembly factor BamB
VLEGSLRRTFLVPFLLAFLAVGGVAACASAESEREPEPEPEVRRAPPGPSDGRDRRVPLQALVRVVDGDTGKAVRAAVVRARRGVGRADRRGVAVLEARRKRPVRALISARGYIPRRVTFPVRSRRAHPVRLWRRALQWPLYGATPARTQAHPAIRLRPPFRVVWSRSIRSLVEFPATVWEGVAYVTNYRGYLTAVSMRNGRILWRRKIANVFASSPAVDPKRRTLVVTSKEPGRATIVDLETGKVRWRFETARAEPSPVIAGDIAYFGDEGGRMYALDLRRRKPRWVFSGGVKITSSPALVGRRLYFGDYAGRVFALDARSGRRIWTGSAGSRVYGAVAVARGRVFAPSVFSGLSALSARTGKLLWRIPAGAYVYSSPAVYRGRVYFGTYGGVVHSVDARSGRILWTRPSGGRVSGAVVVVAGVVYAGTIEGRINAWNWRTGRRLWTFPRGAYVPISGNGARLLVHGRKRLWAVVPKRER